MQFPLGSAMMRLLRGRVKARRTLPAFVSALTPHGLTQDATNGRPFARSIRCPPVMTHTRNNLRTAILALSASIVLPIAPVFGQERR